MDDTTFVTALTASAGVLAGAVIQGVLWLWDKTDHRFRSAVSHFLLVFAVVLVAEKLALDPLRGLHVPKSDSLTAAVDLYNHGLRMAASLLMLIPLAKWIYEQLCRYISGLEVAKEKGLSLHWGETVLVKCQAIILPVVPLMFGLAWYFLSD